MQRPAIGPRFTALAMLVALAGVALPARAAPRALTIDDAVELALRTNPRVAAARERARATELGASAGGRRMLPSVRLSDELQRWNGPFSIAFGPTAFTARDQTTNTFVASADQPVLGLLRANDQREALNEESAADVSQIATVEADLRATVQTQFLRVFEAQALEQIAGESQRELEDQVKVAKARLATGVITEADLLRIEVAVANARQQGLEAHSQGQTARAQLFAAMGIAPADAAELTLVEPADRLRAARAKPEAGSLATLLPQARARRPELVQQGHLVLAADRQASANGYALLPDVDLEAAYLRLYGQPFQPVSSAYIGIKASWAIWEWGATDLARRVAAAQADAARRDREMMERQIEVDLGSSLAQGEAARGAVDTAEKAVSSAEEAYRVTDASLKAGAATTTDLLEAQAALSQARLNLTRAQYELVLSDVALAHATGG